MAPEQQEHAFDFWIGEWEVHDPEGERVGSSSIRPLFGTGAIAEHWRGESGVEGHSLFAGGTMVLEGMDGGVRQRIAWTPDGEGVRQLWETSGDGATWETAFDGRYRRTS